MIRQKSDRFAANFTLSHISVLIHGRRQYVLNVSITSYFAEKEYSSLGVKTIGISTSVKVRNDVGPRYDLFGKSEAWNVQISVGFSEFFDILIDTVPDENQNRLGVVCGHLFVSDITKSVVDQ